MRVASSGRHRPVNVLRPGLGDRSQDRPVGRIDDLDGPAGQPVDELAADVEPGLHPQNSTGWVGNWPLLISWGIFRLAFSQTSSMERFGE